MKKAFRRRRPSPSALRAATSPEGRGIGRPGKPCCSHRPNWAQSAGPCSHWQRLRDSALTEGAGQAVVNQNSEARQFPIAENFARPAQSIPIRQWLPYQGSWHREAMTERLYQGKACPPRTTQRVQALLIGCTRSTSPVSCKFFVLLLLYSPKRGRGLSGP